MFIELLTVVSKHIKAYKRRDNWSHLDAMFTFCEMFAYTDAFVVSNTEYTQ